MDLKQSTIDLIKSDVPLDPRTRQLIAANLQRLLFPNTARDRREQRQREIEDIEDLRRRLENQGMMAKEIEVEIAKALGISVAALRKKMQRSSTRL
jgi:hypothetical protein